MKDIRVRFAPSPTGALHIGGLRTALFNYIFARKNNGAFVLRLEDTDQTRFVAGAEKYIIDALKWCGIEPDEYADKPGDFGPYRQSERLELYKKEVDRLLSNGSAYWAFDSAEELDERRKAIDNWKYDHATRESMKNQLTLSKEEVAALIEKGEGVVRLRMPVDQEISFIDEIRGKVTVNSSELDDKIIYKSDGFPTYHLANVVDDHFMKISHVIRGEEWLPSAPLHIYLFECLGWEDEKPHYAHLPLLLKPEGPGKLSKRDAEKHGFPLFPLEWNFDGKMTPGFKEMGFFPEALTNFLAFLGWNPGTEKEIYSLKELIKDFSLERVNKSGARFDYEKAKWYNQEYLKTMSASDLVHFIPNNDSSNFTEQQVLKIAELMKERVVFAKDLINEAPYFLQAPTEYHEKTVRKKWKSDVSPKILQDMTVRFEQIEDFQAAILEEAFKSYVEENELGFGVAMIALRLALTGVGGGPGLFQISEVLGKEEVLKRMREGVSKIEQQKEALV
ncbi:MAG: glutamate--tRNA ligase [Flavobacteriales bacterium]|nr:glutamate--tRNA ligase [Flavobacteriales bacterium]